MIIHLNGSINSGKTTVGKQLEKLIPNSKFIDADFIINSEAKHPKIEINEWIELTIKEISKKANELVKNGITGIFAYPLEKNHYEYLKKNIDSDFFVFSLNPPINVCLQNRGEGEPNVWERKRIKEHYAQGINHPDFSEAVIDNSKQTPEETAKIILKYIKRKV